MSCQKCRFENPEGMKFCGNCGEPIHRIVACPGCGFENPPGFKFCGECGRSIGGPRGEGRESAAAEHLAPRSYTPKHLAEKILTSRSAVEGERKQVTVLFADVKSSMELAEQIGPEEWHQILDRFFQILTNGVHRFEGTVNQYTGDGIMALFGAPITHEDHAQRACYAALHIRDAVRGYANELRVHRALNFGVRIGLNSGEVVVGRIGDDLRMDYTAQGHTVGLAQRMESLAESGHICLSEHTAHLVKGYFELGDLGPAAVKGIARPIGLFELEGVGSARTRLDISRTRGFSCFVGRVDELAALDAALRQSNQGHGQVVGVVAEAGAGKSRLCFEFLESCRARGIAVYAAHCPAHGRTIPLLPVYELLRSYFGILELDTARIEREKIAGRLLLLDRDFESELPLLWDFLGVPDPDRPAPQTDPEDRQRQLFAFVRRLTQRRSEREPAVLMIDDLHWIDPGSDTLVAQLVESAAGTRTLVLLNFRPEYRADWMQRSHYHQLPLAPLGPEAIRDLAADLLGTDASVAGLPDAIAKRTGGNPFFAEEVVQSLVESGHLNGARGSYRLRTPVDDIKVPASVHTVLAARIDRLSERNKNVLQTAAVIGPELAGPVLASVVELQPDELAGALAELQAAEFLYERVLYPEAEYAFKHPLTQEVAYQTQLGERRRKLHGAVARALEERGESAALLAYHWDAAEEAEKAVFWHRRAAEKIGVLHVAESIRHWRRVLELLDRLPETPQKCEQAADVRAHLLFSMVRHGGGADGTEAARLFEEAQALARQGSSPASFVRSLASYAQYCIYRGQEAEGLDLADRAVAEADSLADPSLQVAARWGQAVGSYFMGNYARVVEISSKALTFGADEQGAQVLGFSESLLLRASRAGSFAMLGRADEARQDLERTIELGSDRNSYAVQICRCFHVVLALLVGDHGAALAQVRHALNALEEIRNPAGEVWSHFMMGVALALNQEWTEASAALDHALQTARIHQTFLHAESEMAAWSALARLESGGFAAATAALEQATAAARRSGARAALPLIHLVRARANRIAGQQGADAALVSADDAARAIGARLWEPLIWLERARLHETHGDAQARRRALGEAHRLYTEMGAAPNARRVEHEMQKR